MKNDRKGMITFITIANIIALLLILALQPPGVYTQNDIWSTVSLSGESIYGSNTGSISDSDSNSNNNSNSNSANTIDSNIVAEDEDSNGNVPIEIVSQNGGESRKEEVAEEEEKTLTPTNTITNTVTTTSISDNISSGSSSSTSSSFNSSVATSSSIEESEADAFVVLSTNSDGEEQYVFHSDDDQIVVTDQAMGARCAVAADFDGDGRMDIVSASSNDNAVSWFRNEGPCEDDPDRVCFSIKQKITWSSLGSRIVTVADIDGDGCVDVIGASYYDSSLRWFENDCTGQFTEHVISTAVNEGQGVTVADLDNDGDPDIATASSGDNTIAVFKNIDNGVFCEIKEVVDDNAIGARTVVAADLNGDGWIDLASASKDDDTVAWYPNDGTGHFQEKLIVSQGIESKGAYSLVAADIDGDGDDDLIVASNGNDHVSLWRNDGKGNFNKTLVFDEADFVLSVTAVDFDRDGYIDIASASFFDGYVRWYKNVDGKGYEWQNYTVYEGIQGHYVSHADIDGDGDDDLISVDHAENSVHVFLADTGCDRGHVNDTVKQECCHVGTEWTGSNCEPCRNGTYGILDNKSARCVACPTDTCRVPGETLVPLTCAGTVKCKDNIEESVKECSCPTNSVKDSNTDTCLECPDGQIRIDVLDLFRGVDTLGNYSAWEMEQGVCVVPEPEEVLNQIDKLVPIGLTLMVIALGLSIGFAGWTWYYRRVRVVRASQPFFLIMLCAGTAFLSLAIIPIGIDDKNHSVEACSSACMSIPWLLCIGFTIAFSAAISKLWRIHKVFTQKLRRIKITERDVLKPFAILMSVMVILLIIWTAADPLEWQRLPVKEDQPWETYGSCIFVGVTSKVCAGLMGAIVLVGLILGCILVYKTRMISDEYSESQYIGFAIICWLQLLLVSAPLILFVNSNPTASYFLRTALIFLIAMSLLLLIFVPKIARSLKKEVKRSSSVYISGIDLSQVASSVRSMSGGGGGGGSGSFQTTSETTSSELFATRASLDDTSGYYTKSEVSEAGSEGGMGLKITSPQIQIRDLKKEIQSLKRKVKQMRGGEKGGDNGAPRKKSIVNFAGDEVPVLPRSTNDDDDDDDYYSPTKKDESDEEV